MEIFGKHIFGSDAEQFKSLPILNQVEWIKKNTNQKNDDLIDEFLSNIPENNDKQCLNCGTNGNIGKGVSKEIESVVINNEIEEFSGRRINKRRKNSKNT